MRVGLAGRNRRATLVVGLLAVARRGRKAVDAGLPARYPSVFSYNR